MNCATSGPGAAAKFRPESTRKYLAGVNSAHRMESFPGLHAFRFPFFALGATEFAAQPPATKDARPNTDTSVSLRSPLDAPSSVGKPGGKAMPSVANSWNICVAAPWRPSVSRTSSGPGGSPIIQYENATQPPLPEAERPHCICLRHFLSVLSAKSCGVKKNASSVRDRTYALDPRHPGAGRRFSVQRPDPRHGGRSPARRSSTTRARGR